MIWPIDREQLITRPLVYKKSEVWSLCISQFQQRQPPPPPPGLLRGICLPCQSRWWSICKFCAARGPGICQPWGFSQAFDTYAVFYQNITTQRILLEKQAYWLICQGQEKIEDGCKGMHVLNFMHAFLQCLSSQNYTAKSGPIDVNQSFLVTWIKFLLILHVFEEHPFIFTV